MPPQAKKRREQPLCHRCHRPSMDAPSPRPRPRVPDGPNRVQLRAATCLSSSLSSSIPTPDLARAVSVLKDAVARNLGGRYGLDNNGDDGFSPGYRPVVLKIDFYSVGYCRHRHSPPYILIRRPRLHCCPHPHQTHVYCYCASQPPP